MAQTCKAIRPRSASRIACCRAASALLDPVFFRALAEPTRVAVLCCLFEHEGPATVGQIAACCPIDLSVVSRHLAALKAAGIVESQRTGKEVRYRVQWAALADTLRAIAEAIDACCPPHQNPKEVPHG